MRIENKDTLFIAEILGIFLLIYVLCDSCVGPDWRGLRLSSKNVQRGNQSTEFGHLHRPYVVGFIIHEACVSSKNLFLGGNTLNLGKCAGPALLCLRMFVGSMPYA
jgi:hypothetical protein